MKRFDARQKVLQKLDNLGLYKGKKEHSMTLPVCSRSGDIIEQRLKDQWYIDCAEMVCDAAEAVKEGKLELIPENYSKIWYEWLESPNSSSWCISRQLWWGHKIPAYRIIDDGGTDTTQSWIVARNEEEARKKAAEKLQMPASEIKLEQDDDVLDTWFSSGIFPFSIFGWPQQTSDLNKFYPTDLLETASDILFFWVARMVMLGQKLTGKLPFNKVLLHSILRDSHGRKMSKSLGNIIDPMDVITGISLQELNQKVQDSNLSAAEIKKAQAGQKKDFPLGIAECGTDALRFTLCGYHYMAHFTNVDVVHIQSNRNFCNKIWQAFRFCQSHWAKDFTPIPVTEVLTNATRTDRWMLSRLSRVVEECDKHMNSLELYHATKALHTFWWSDLCDIYLEYGKSQLTDDQRKAVVQTILFMCVDVGLRCLGPFMPYITEELFQRLPGAVTDEVPSICVAPYPKPYQYSWKDDAVEKEVVLAKQVISSIRLLRKWLGLTKTKLPVYLLFEDRTKSASIENHLDLIATLSRSASINVVEDSLDIDKQEALSKVKTDLKKLESNINRQKEQLCEIPSDDALFISANQKLQSLELDYTSMQSVCNQLQDLL